MMRLRNKHDNDGEWDKIKEYPTQEEIIAFNRKENSNKRKERIHFLQQQIAAGDRLDGYVLEGHREELKRLEEEDERLNKTD
jgi:hypothetical protein